MDTPNEPKALKGQFKCYSCRKIYPNRDGDWHNWEQMQVHLCRNCEKTTKENGQRKRGDS